MTTQSEQTPHKLSVVTGFKASLSGLGVSDLVQMQCLSGQTLCFRVVSNSEVGWLHFANGTIVHASVGTLEGDNAVLKILAWQEGSFDPIAGVAPERKSVQTSWQSLLLQAAQRLDEGSRVATRMRDVEAVPDSSWVRRELVAPKIGLASIGAEQKRKEDTRRVSIDEFGNIMSTFGEHEDLAAEAAFAAELAQMIAEGLGVERAQGIELREPNITTIVSIGTRGELDIVRGNDGATLVEIRRATGL